MIVQIQHVAVTNSERRDEGAPTLRHHLTKEGEGVEGTVGEIEQNLRRGIDSPREKGRLEARG